MERYTFFLDGKWHIRVGEHQLSGPWVDRLAAFEEAAQNNRLFILPCAPYAKVYTVETEYFDCEHCEHGSNAKYDKEIGRTCCPMEHDEDCPRYIQAHVVDGFDIRINKALNGWELSGPGEDDWKGLKPILGEDGKCYYSRIEAEDAMTFLKGG